MFRLDNFHKSIFTIFALVACLYCASCSNRQEIEDVARSYVEDELGGVFIREMIVGEGDAQNVYITVDYSDAKGKNCSVLLLIQKDEVWAVSKIVSHEKK